MIIQEYWNVIEFECPNCGEIGQMGEDDTTSTCERCGEICQLV